jgi:hypothetical protein
MLNDAREIAIATEYADRMARWAWWDNLEKMLSDMLNLAMLVAVPFAPELGVLMLAYTAYQVTDQIVEESSTWPKVTWPKPALKPSVCWKVSCNWGFSLQVPGGQRGTGQALAVF